MVVRPKRDAGDVGGEATGSSRGRWREAATRRAYAVAGVGGVGSCTSEGVGGAGWWRWRHMDGASGGRNKEER